MTYINFYKQSANIRVFVSSDSQLLNLIGHLSGASLIQILYLAATIFLLDIPQTLSSSLSIY